jgi:hypothetical protein
LREDKKVEFYDVDSILIATRMSLRQSFEALAREIMNDYMMHMTVI